MNVKFTSESIHRFFAGSVWFFFRILYFLGLRTSFIKSTIVAGLIGSASSYISSKNYQRAAKKLEYAISINACGSYALSAKYLYGLLLYRQLIQGDQGLGLDYLRNAAEAGHGDALIYLKSIKEN